MSRSRRSGDCWNPAVSGGPADCGPRPRTAPAFLLMASRPAEVLGDSLDRGGRSIERLCRRFGARDAERLEKLSCAGSHEPQVGACLKELNSLLHVFFDLVGLCNRNADHLFVLLRRFHNFLERFFNSRMVLLAAKSQ